VHRDTVPYYYYNEPRFYLSTGQQDFLEKARSWIQDCHYQHKCCGGMETHGSFVPSRLLHVGTAAHPRCRVVEKPELQNMEGLQYFALSHCWGGKVDVQLLTSNHVSMTTDGILPVNLPRNFRDAVRFTLYFGVQYIWIDSLCIIQDSPEDWAHESVLMAGVYANAACTVSSTASADSSGGCFHHFSPPRGTFSIVANDTCGLRIHAPGAEIPTAELFRTRVLDGPVSKRAWVFQERLLSRRIVHFCSDTVFFECDVGQRTDRGDFVFFNEGVPSIEFNGSNYRKDIVAVVEAKQTTERSGGRWEPSEVARRIMEGVPADLVKAIEAGYYRDCATTRGIRDAFKRMKAIKGPALSNVVVAVEFNTLWYELVSYYSATGLTVPSDRLVAISGIAALIESETGATYLSGL
jgi:hypothetical protein